MCLYIYVEEENKQKNRINGADHGVFIHNKWVTARISTEKGQLHSGHVHQPDRYRRHV